MEQRIVFNGPKRAELEAFSVPAVKDGEVEVRVSVSLMSTGTEGIIYNRWFDPGTHWDNWIKYPFHPGYSAVGTVAAAGSGVSSPKVGDRVAIRKSHASAHVLPAAQCIVVPPVVSDEQAAWFALAKIAAMGARVAGHGLGSSVLVIGAGPIGQMAIRWAFVAGAEAIIVVDPVGPRLELARVGGATATIDKPIAEAAPLILQANHGSNPRVVIDSTGNAEVFAVALSVVERFGTVVVLGDTGAPAQQRLSPDLITKGLRVVGAHDTHETAEWNAGIIARLFFQAVSDGRFRFGSLVSHTFPPQEAGAAYELATHHRKDTMGILFDWKGRGRGK
ncbi:MAG TPA: zinc-binding alcohol dehydrogenase [Spirochaetia bacterium]|nr:zinc-binding alcohol dehydrogenase [Spirochaetia bacterium]